jgi:hypothetical protein
MNIALTIRKNQIEENTDVLEAGAFLASTSVDAGGRMTSVISRGR